jgi:acyl-CoA reductase-like NAD-dependent aldehyde dehydrogenase
MPTDTLPLFIAGERVESSATDTVIAKHTGDAYREVSLATAEHMERAIEAAHNAREPLRHLPAWRRRETLEHITRRLDERSEDFARAMSIEVGKTLKDARGEVGRAVETFRLSAQEAERIVGVWMPLDGSARGERHHAIIRRVPVGACSFIVPFNFPLNLAAHKVGPAIACGCPFVLKPDTQASVAVWMLAEILAECDLPAGSWSLTPVEGDARDALTTDERFAMLSFTGSPKVGWALKSKAGRKRVHLELGGNAACIVDETADLDRVVDRVMLGGYGTNGQSCISVQRVLAVESIAEELVTRLAARVGALRVGDPLDEATDIGPLFHADAPERIASWVAEAEQGGARVVVEGRADGRIYRPALLDAVTPEMKVSCAEIFGPVVGVTRCRDFDEALRLADDSPYGLQAGVFTRDIHRAFRAFDALEVGGVNINDVPSMRLDAMPYGGVKQSGLGREGPRCMIEEMTEPRQMLLCDIGF